MRPRRSLRALGAMVLATVLALGETTAPTSASPVGPSGVSVVGTSLYLNGEPWQFKGINAPEAATDYAVNGGCGAAFDLPSFFDSLPRDSVVRVGFSQDATIDEGPGLSHTTVNRDWQALDRVVAAADQSTSHVRLIVDLGNEGGTCDGGVFKTDQWYQSGYLQPYVGADGYARSSYWEYLQQVVGRYAGNPAIFMWEPMGDAEAADCAPGYSGDGCYSHKSCPADATAMLVNWFDQVGAEIHALDPGSLVGTGDLSDQQCGWANGGELLIDEAAGVDVASFHDYGSDDVALPAGLEQAIADAKEANKPLVVGEVGIAAGNGCPTSLAERSSELRAKLTAAFSAGVAGWLPWTYGTGTNTACDYYILPADPALDLLATAAGYFRPRP
ncbi:MAG: cellulase family glycosylhydrolase [Acidimicrobiales bacterium]